MLFENPALLGATAIRTVDENRCVVVSPVTNTVSLVRFYDDRAEILATATSPTPQPMALAVPHLLPETSSRCVVSGCHGFAVFNIGSASLSLAYYHEYRRTLQGRPWCADAQSFVAAAGGDAIYGYNTVSNTPFVVSHRPEPGGVAGGFDRCVVVCESGGRGYWIAPDQHGTMCVWRLFEAENSQQPLTGRKISPQAFVVASPARNVLSVIVCGDMLIPEGEYKVDEPIDRYQILEQNYIVYHISQRTPGIFRYRERRIHHVDAVRDYISTADYISPERLEQSEPAAVSVLSNRACDEEHLQALNDRWQRQKPVLYWERSPITAFCRAPAPIFRVDEPLSSFLVHERDAFRFRVMNSVLFDVFCLRYLGHPRGIVDADLLGGHLGVALLFGRHGSIGYKTPYHVVRDQ